MSNLQDCTSNSSETTGDACKLPIDRFIDRFIDRLVDGELSDAEYERLLQELDRCDDGWKQCALAFLEAQALRKDVACFFREDAAIGETTKTAPADDPVTPTKRPGAEHRKPKPKTRNERVFGLLISAAASFLIAFGLGATMREWTALFRGEPVASISNEPNDGGFQGADQAPDRTQPLLASDPRQSPHVVAGDQDQVVFVVDDGVHKQQVRLPVLGAEELDDPWFHSRAETSPQLIEAFRQSGRRIQARRFMTPMRLGNGQRILVPVEQWEFAPSPPRRYQ